MSQVFSSYSSGFRRWKRMAVAWGCVLFALLVAFLLMWNTFFTYVPPGSHLVITAKDGEPLPSGQILAEGRQKGIQKEVKGEGWHFILPIVYTTELEKNTEVPAGKIGIVTSLGGTPLPPGVLAEEGEQGIRREILPPGSYRINLHGYKVDLEEATDIPPGYVGVQRRRMVAKGIAPEAKGVLLEVLQPGLYYLNTREFEILKAEIGIIQTAFHFEEKASENTAITFTSKGGFSISLDCTIEWEVLPQDMPSLIVNYGGWKAVEENVINLQAKAIGRDRGIEYGVQDFLEGNKREKFQQDFTKELTEVCRQKNVTVHSAFIRNIVIPEAYLKPIREKQIAYEKELTNKAKEVTAQSEFEMKQEEQAITVKVGEVEAETDKMVALIERDIENITTRNQAEIDKMTAEYQAKIAALDAQQSELLGKTKAHVTNLRETARSGIYQLQMDLFQSDMSAFLRYNLAKELNPKLVMRLFQSGQGTFWTNMEGKGMNLMLPMPATAAQPKAK